MSWKNNGIMYWSSDNGVTWNMVSDHSRDALDVSVERFEKKNRTVDATLRRYTVAKKRTFSASWSMLPSKITPTYLGKIGVGTADAGLAGEDIEAFHNSVDGAFLMKLRKGTDEAKAITDSSLEIVTVMITDFSKTIVKRGIVDFWTLDITLEEV